MSNTANIVRLECDLSDPYRPLVNAITSAAPQLARARDYRFEIGVRDKGIWQPSISQFGGITLEVMATTRTGARLMTKTVAAPFSDIAEGEWLNRTGQHAAITFTEVETALTLLTLEDTFWLALTATNVSGRKVTLAAGTITMLEDGGQYSAAAPAPSTPGYLNTDQVIAAIQSAMKDLEVRSNGYVAKPTIDVNGQIAWDIRPE